MKCSLAEREINLRLLAASFDLGFKPHTVESVVSLMWFVRRSNYYLTEISLKQQVLVLMF